MRVDSYYMNRRLRRRKEAEKPRVKNPSSLQEEWEQLEDQRGALAERVRKLESDIVAAPRLSLEYRLSHRDVVPPPDVPTATYSVTLQEDRRLSYGQQHRMQRNRHRNLAIFLLLLCAAAAFVLWVARTVLQ